jgi:hypothetical protein
VTWYDKAAWKEAVTDTAIGTIINFPLNLLSVWVIFELQLTVLQSTVLLWAVFTVIAVFRKYILRIYFKGKNKVAKQ